MIILKFAHGRLCIVCAEPKKHAGLTNSLVLHTQACATCAKVQTNTPPTPNLFKLREYSGNDTAHLLSRTPTDI